MRKTKNMGENFLLLLIVFSIHLTAQATPQSTTFQARIIKPDGNYLEDANVPFRFTMLAPVANCILSVEDFGVYSMTGSRGTVAINLGQGAAVFIAAPATNFSEIFNNFPSSPFSCQGGGTYMPASDDSRRLIPQFYALGQWNTLPTLAVNSVPYANYAGLAAKLTGLPNCNPATEALSYNGTAFTCLAIGSGAITALTGDITASGTGSVAATIAANAVTTAKINDAAITAAKLSSMDATTGQIMKWNGAAWVASSDISGVGTETDPNVPAWAKAASLDLTVAAVTGVLPISKGGTGAGAAGVANNFVFAGPTSGGPSAPSFRSLASGDIPSLSGSYLTKAGVAGGQSASGGTAASENLILDSTVHATKGNIILNPTGGNVGIGTATPSTKLRVEFADASDGVTVVNTTTTSTKYPHVGVINYKNGTNGHPYLYLQNSEGTQAAPAALGQGANLGTIVFEGQTSATSTAQGGRIEVLAEAAFSGTSNPAQMLFSTADVTGSYQNRMIIKGNGNVGIGTTSPTAALHLKAGTVAANTAPLKLSSGDLTTTPEAGAIEYDGTNLFYTDSTATRRALASASGGGAFTNVTSITGSGALSVAAGGTNQNLTLAGSGTGVVTTASPLTITNSTASTSSGTGAATISGGLGVGGDIFSGASVNAGTSVTAATSVISPQIYGSTAASGDIKIDGTSNASKGNVLLATAGGNVGIGTASPQAKLDVNGGIGASSIQSYAGNLEINTLGNNLLIGKNGSVNVGIGTTAPTATLDIKGTALSMGDPALYYNTFLLRSLYGPGGNAFDISMFGQPFLGSYTGNITLASNSGNNEAYRNNYPSSKVVLDAGRFQVSTAGAGAVSTAITWSEKFRIDNAGNVGIGTTAPTSRLQIGDSTASTANQLVIGKYEASTEGNLPIIQQKSAVNAGAGNDLALGAQSTSGGILFYTGLTGIGNQLGTGSNAARMTINAAGNVGIGTTAPVAKLNISSSTYDGIRVNDGANSFLQIYVNAGSGSNNGITQVGDKVISYGGPVIDSAGGLVFAPWKSNTSGIRLDSLGNVGIGTTTPTAALHLKAGTVAAGTAPLKLTSGDLTTVAEAGAIEYDGTNLFYTDGTATRRAIATTSGTSTFNNVTSINNSAGNITLAAAASTGSVLINSNAASTASTNGALVVTGGVGVSGDIYSAASINAGTTISAATSVLTPQLYGSNAASGDIKIDGTSHATKGNVLLATAGGNVGIGTVTPGKILTIQGSDPSIRSQWATARADGSEYVAGGIESLFLTRDFNQNTAAYVRILDVNTNGLFPTAVRGGAVAFGTVDGGTGFDGNPAIERMRIDSSGNVGVGTTNPTVKTHIFNSVDGVFNGLVVDNRKVYGVGSGTNEESRIILSLSEGANPNPLTRVMGYISSGTEGELTSDNGFLALGTRSGMETEKMRITSTGNVGIGTTAPSEKLEVIGNVKATAFISTSDQRLKTNLQPITDGLDKIRNIAGYKYDWKSNGLTEYGVMAQEVEKIMPEVVVTNAETGLKGVKYNGLIAPIIEAIKELYAKWSDDHESIISVGRDISSLKKENEELKKKNENLEQRLKNIEKQLDLQMSDGKRGWLFFIFCLAFFCQPPRSLLFVQHLRARWAN